jgi:CheY-like chemotaxis protein
MRNGLQRKPKNASRMSGVNGKKTMVNMSDKDLQVLIIEDEQLLNEAYARVLSAANIALLRAYNGKEALDILKTEKPDIILLDLRMPVMDGIEFLKNLKPKENLPEAKIIVFSNYDDQHEIDEAFSLGAMHYMLKAWPPQTNW